FTRERVPVGVGVLLDISDSMYGRRIEEARAAVDRFLLELLDPGDEFFVLAFNHQPHILTGWTNTPTVVRRSMETLRPSGGTAAYDAVIAAMPLVARRNRERAALLLISDGADTASTATIREVRAALLRSVACVFRGPTTGCERGMVTSPMRRRARANETGYLCGRLSSSALTTA